MLSLQKTKLSSNYEHKNNINFAGLKLGRINLPSSISRISNCKLDDVYGKLTKKVAPDFIQKIGGDTFFKKSNALLDTAKFPFTRLPKEALNWFANTFKIKSLQNSDLLKNFAKLKDDEAAQRALRGLFENGDNFIAELAAKKGIDPKDIEKMVCGVECNPEFEEICKGATKKFYELFDKNLAKDKAHYHTPHERTVVRLVSGITAAIMLGNDFYNKSIMNGVDDKEATKEAKSKRRQEISATVQEAISQYFLLGAFSSFTNKSKWGAPILNTALGVLFHITSRLSNGKKLTRMKLEESSFKGLPNLEEFKEKTKKEEKIEVKAPQKEKKHLLTLKNIGLACLASIGIGFALKGAKSTKAFKALKETIENTNFVKTTKDKLHKFTVGEVWVDKKEYLDFVDRLDDVGYEKMKKFYNGEILPKFKNGEKLLLGEYEKMCKIPFTNIQMSKKELIQIPLMPFKFATELLSYPYKAAHKIAEGLKWVKKPEEIKLKNDFGILNTYREYQELLAKHGGTTNQKFLDAFKERLDKNILSALNKETQSSVKNAAIGKTTQLLGTFGSLYFAMTDDFNRTAKQTGDKQKAEKDARLRGVNKIIRIATQIVIMKMNDIFKIPYAQSILGAGLITAACTVLTDSISRILSGMPFKKMNKEELEAYNKNKKEGILRHYYNGLDRLTD